MRSTCSEKQTEIIQQISGFDWAKSESSNGASETTPFTLGGRIYSTRPQSLTNVSEKRRRKNALKNPEGPDYLKDSNYYNIPIQADNILGPDSQTTLRYNNERYTQQFVAIHRNLWYPQKEPQLSMFFTSEEGNFFHICLPVKYSSTGKDENKFISFWLNTSNKEIPVNLTINELLNNSLRTHLGISEYCFSYNQRTISKKYNLCLVKEPITVFKASLPQWIQNDFLFNVATTVNEDSKPLVDYKKSFDEILNYILRGTFENKENRGFLDIHLVSKTTFFKEGTTNIISPQYFDVETKSLTGIRVKDSFSTQPGIKLQNVKCYPIDLLTQVNDDGSIRIDDSTNRAINPAEFKNKDSDQEKLNPEIAIRNKKSKDWWIFMISAIIIFAVLVILFIIVLNYILSEKGNTSVESNIVAQQIPVAVTGATQA